MNRLDPASRKILEKPTKMLQFNRYLNFEFDNKPVYQEKTLKEEFEEWVSNTRIFRGKRRAVKMLGVRYRIEDKVWFRVHQLVSASKDPEMDGIDGEASKSLDTFIAQPRFHWEILHSTHNVLSCSYVCGSSVSLDIRRKVVINNLTEMSGGNICSMLNCIDLRRAMEDPNFQLERAAGNAALDDACEVEDVVEVTVEDGGSVNQSGELVAVKKCNTAVSHLSGVFFSTAPSEMAYRVCSQGRTAWCFAHQWFFTKAKMDISHMHSFFLRGVYDMIHYKIRSWSRIFIAVVVRSRNFECVSLIAIYGYTKTRD